MGTTKEQRRTASAIIEKFTANDVTFPADFVLALLSDADERDRLAEENANLLGYLAEIRDMIGAWPPTDENLDGYATSYPDGVVDLVRADRNRLAERVRELEHDLKYTCLSEEHKHDGLSYHYARAETAEAKLAVAVEALEFYSRNGEGFVAKEALAKIKGAP